MSFFELLFFDCARACRVDAVMLMFESSASRKGTGSRLIAVSYGFCFAVALVVGVFLELFDWD